MYNGLLTHSPVDRHLDDYWFGAINNKGAMNIPLQSFCENTHSFLLDNHLEVEFLSWMISIYLTL